jgi:Fuc2NAc and GlcNAc transferase
MMDLLQQELMIVYLLAAFITSTLLVAVVRRYAIKRLLDHPNERSSHATPTPRGGGLAIAIVFHLGVAGLWWMNILPIFVALALLGGGLLVALIGWLDDHRHIPAGWRALVHVVASSWAVYCLGGISQLNLGSFNLPLSGIGSILAVIGIVWLINLYNFMDGIDGIAGGQGICAALMGGALLWLAGNQGLAVTSWLLAATCAGFLVWNWPPARIFMGDVGSGLIGFIFGVLALASEQADAVPILIWVLLLALFVGDSTLTLLKRLIQGEKWYTAHRSHGYQRLIQRGLSHQSVTVRVIGFNILVLWPLALWGWQVPEWLLWLFLATAILMVFIWWRIQRSCAVEN